MIFNFTKDAETLGGKKASYFAPLESIGYFEKTVLMSASTTKIESLGQGVYRFAPVNAKLTDLPSGVNASASNVHFLVVMENSAQKVYILTETLSGKAWIGKTYGSGITWKEVFTTNGGTVNGNIEAVANAGEQIAFILDNDTRRVALVVRANGDISLMDSTNSKDILYSLVNGKTVFNGTSVDANNLNVYGGNEVNFKGFTDGVGLFFNYRDGNTNQANTKALDWFRFGSGLANGTDAVQIDMTKGAGTLRDILHTGNMADYVLPKTGGTVNGTVEVSGSDIVVDPLRVISNHKADNRVLIEFRKGSAVQGYLGFYGGNNPIFVNTATGASHTLHHDGNSAKVHIGTSAPSDTTALWIDTSA